MCKQLPVCTLQIHLFALAFFSYCKTNSCSVCVCVSCNVQSRPEGKTVCVVEFTVWTAGIKSGPRVTALQNQHQQPPGFCCEFSTNALIGLWLSWTTWKTWNSCLISKIKIHGQHPLLSLINYTNYTFIVPFALRGQTAF